MGKPQPQPQLRDPWQEIEDLSAAVYQLAAQSRWLEATELYKQRHSLLEKFFSAGVPAGQHDRVRSGIIHILQCDDALKTMAEFNRSSLVEEFQEQNKRGNAAKAYSKTHQF